MSGVILSAADRSQLLRRMRQQTAGKVHRRMNVLLLLDGGWTAERIAEALFIDAETVRGHRLLYQRQGVAGLEKLACQGGECVLGQQQQAELCVELDRRIFATAAEVCDLVKARFATSHTADAMSKLLGRLGFVHKKPKKVPAKANAEVQKTFLTKTPAPLMAKGPLCFVDGTHPTHTAHPVHDWMRQGQTRELPGNHGRTSININGALSWPDRTLVWLPAEKITSLAMIEPFERLQALDRTATAISLVIDNARHNHSAEVKAYLERPGCRIRLVYLPAHAPNLNLIERSWRLMKKEALGNEYYPTFAEFRMAITGFLDNIADYQAKIATLITDKFEIIGVSNPQIP